jgi:TIR domain
VRTVDGRRIAVWLYVTDIPAGGSIPAHIQQGILESKRFGILMTPSYFASRSGWTDAEWHSAIFPDPDNRSGKLLTLMAGDCDVPPLLRQFKHIDIRGSRYSQGIDAVVRALTPSNGSRGISPSSSRMVESAEPDAIDETLYTNLFALERVPKTLYTAQLSPTVIPRRGPWLTASQIESRIRNDTQKAPVFAIYRDQMRSFIDPAIHSSPLQKYVLGNSVRRISIGASEVLSAHRNAAVALLNAAIDRHLVATGIRADSTRDHRYLYPPSEGRTERRVTWTPSKRSATRSVAAPYVHPTTGEVLFWRHHAAYLRIAQLGSKYVLHISPTYVLTENGSALKKGPRIGKIIARWTQKERNFQVFYNVLFWRWTLARGGDDVFTGGQPIRVSRMPISLHNHRGIANDRRDFKRDIENLETEAEVESPLDIDPLVIDSEDDGRGTDDV